MNTVYIKMKYDTSTPESVRKSVDKRQVIHLVKCHKQKMIRDNLCHLQLGGDAPLCANSSMKFINDANEAIRDNERDRDNV